MNKKLVKQISILLVVILVVFCIGCVIINNTRRIDKDDNLDNLKNYNLSELYLNPSYKEKLIIFPEIENSKMVEDYSSVKVYQGLELMAINIYLQVAYSEEDYQIEIDRLSKWSRTYSFNGNIGTGKLKYDHNELFNYSAYISSYNYCYAYKYALLIGENKIVYVFLSRARENEAVVPKKFMPIRYFDILEKSLSGNLESRIEAETENSFSIYHDISLVKE